MDITLDERTKQDFLTYANSVIKSRAIPRVEDNLKPIHRKILWTMYEDKLFPEKKTSKCASVVGDALHYSPHGDASVYGALVRLSQWWKLRYPLVVFQGNGGNVLGDTAAASRYTETKLSPVGMLMLDELNKNCVDMKPNYSGEQLEPTVLPSRFPWLLCGNNSGIAVGMSSDLVSHNYSEVAEGIKYYLNHKDCTIADLMQFIKGPDFPTGGKIINGEDLLNIYTVGHGAVKIAAHYDISKKGAKTVVTFHDLPYGVEIDSGVKTPLKKLVLDEGYDVFEDIVVEKVGPHNFDIKITLSKDADVAKCIEILFNKTRLCDSVKINNTVIVDGEPKLLNLKQMIEYWVNFRSSIICRVARDDYEKTNHKLTVVIGLQKCMSNIDKVISLIRNADNSSAAKCGLMKEFALTDEQATAVLDMKLGRLSKLDLTELNDSEKEYEETIARLKNIIENESVRYDIIKKDLDDMKKIIGEDSRLTEIYYSKAIANENQPRIKDEYLIYNDGLHVSSGTAAADPGLVDVQFAYSPDELMGYTSEGTMRPINELGAAFVGAFAKNGAAKMVTVTKNGNVKVSLASDYKFKTDEKLMRIKDGDQLVFAGLAGDDDYLMLFNGERNVLRLAVKDLAVATKMTVGVKSGFNAVKSAAIVKESDNLLFVTKDNKGKLTPVKDFSIDSRGNKGQIVAEGTSFMRKFDDGREYMYLMPQNGKPISIARGKVSIKGRTAVGAALTSRTILQVI